jgi:hypothetical protein
MVMGLVVPEIKNDRAGEGQQQLTQKDKNEFVCAFIIYLRTTYHMPITTVV